MSFESKLVLGVVTAAAGATLAGCSTSPETTDAFNEGAVVVTGEAQVLPKLNPRRLRSTRTVPFEPTVGSVVDDTSDPAQMKLLALRECSAADVRSDVTTVRAAVAGNETVTARLVTREDGGQYIEFCKAGETAASEEPTVLVKGDSSKYPAPSSTALRRFKIVPATGFRESARGTSKRRNRLIF